MVKAITANAVMVNDIRIQLHPVTHQIKNLVIHSTVNYGTFGLNEEDDLYNILTVAQKAQLQAAVDKLLTKLTELKLG